MMKLSTKQKAIFALCIVALSFVILNIAVRMMSEAFGIFTQVYLRIGGGFLLALILFRKHLKFSKIKHITKKDWLLLSIMGTVGYGIAVLFITMSVQQATLMNVSVISSTVPFFALLYMIIFTKKTISPLLFGFLTISFIGVYLIAAKSFYPSFTNFGFGELYALLFAAGSGAFVVSRKFLSKHLISVEITVIILGIAFLSSFIGAMFFGEKLDFAGFLKPIPLAGFLIGSVLNIVATQFQNFGFNHVSAVVGSQLLLLQNIFAPILGFFLFHETVLPIEFLGAGLILLGVYAYNKKAAD